jgi:hypothetical protein
MLQETSKVEVLRICASMDEQMDERTEEGTHSVKGNGRR